MRTSFFILFKPTQLHLFISFCMINLQRQQLLYLWLVLKGAIDGRFELTIANGEESDDI